MLHDIRRAEGTLARPGQPTIFHRLWTPPSPVAGVLLVPGFG